MAEKSLVNDVAEMPEPDVDDPAVVGVAEAGGAVVAAATAVVGVEDTELDDFDELLHAANPSTVRRAAVLAPTFVAEICMRCPPSSG